MFLSKIRYITSHWSVDPKDKIRQIRAIRVRKHTIRMVNSCHSREIRVQRKLIRMVKIRAYLCHMWENKNTIRMVKSVFI